MPGNPELRQRLSDLMDGPSRSPAADWPQRLAELQADIPHSIQALPNPLAGVLPLHRFTCFPFAIGIAADKRYIAIASRYQQTFAGEDFMGHALKSKIFNGIAGRTIRDGDLLLYFDENTPKHAGVTASERVRSKWGDGQFFEHDVWEVPQTYGNISRAFEPISPEEAMEAFANYARSNGQVPEAFLRSLKV